MGYHLAPISYRYCVNDMHIIKLSNNATNTVGKMRNIFVK